MLWNGNESRKNKSNSRQPFPLKITIDQKQLENVESFKYLGSILTNDGRCTGEIECRKNKISENFKTTIPTKNYDRPKTTRECGIF